MDFRAETLDTGSMNDLARRFQWNNRNFSLGFRQVLINTKVPDCIGRSERWIADPRAPLYYSSSRVLRAISKEFRVRALLASASGVCTPLENWLEVRASVFISKHSRFITSRPRIIMYLTFHSLKFNILFLRNLAILLSVKSYVSFSFQSTKLLLTIGAIASVWKVIRLDRKFPFGDNYGSVQLPINLGRAASTSITIKNRRLSSCSANLYAVYVFIRRISRGRSSRSSI